MMSTAPLQQTARTNLKPGDRVRVRSAEEILKTIDSNGELDGLPFMPEMLQYCERIMTVSMRADKTCNGLGTVRWMDDVVHLADIRCDGSEHDGCQAACKIFWKEAWLERVSQPDHQGMNIANSWGETERGIAIASEKLLPLAKVDGDPDPRFRCQATEVLKASRPLPLWELQQYRTDMVNWNLPKIVRNFIITVFNHLQDLSRNRFPEWMRIRKGERYPFVIGRLPKTPRATLELRPGDRVRVKSKNEIVATLDTKNRNRGLLFDAEMLRYCGKVGTVRSRVERLIDEHTGRMIEIDSDCVTLEGMVCQADYHRLCAREIYHYWREIWLERIP